MKIKNIKITDFALRHFNQEFAGTKVGMDPIEFEEATNSTEAFDIIDGYADFCKIIVFHNTDTVRCGSMEISMENSRYIRSGYSSRDEEELPVLSRWFELPYELKPPFAKYLSVIVYNKEQMEKENDKSFDGDWGIVSIQGTNEPFPDPIPPITMMRNSLGIEEGGSGVELDRKEYLKSVDFWNKNIIIK